MKKLIKSYMEPHKIWRIFCMAAAIELMGFSLSLLILTDMGTDPFSYMNLGFSSALKISFGTWQLLVNVILFLITLKFEKKLIGIGTLVNMTAVGYTADFFTALWKQIPSLEKPLPAGMRMGILLGALLLFVATAAVYMTAELGTAPYDAVPFILAEKTGKSFRLVRMLWDTAAAAAGLILGGKIGVITLLMVLSLGPAVAWFGEHGAGKLFSVVPEKNRKESSRVQIG